MRNRDLERKIETNDQNQNLEIYRKLRNRINLSGKTIKTISIISNDRNDGKSQVAYSLAESYAKTGKKVLLVDGNLREPQLSLQLADNIKLGLNNILRVGGSVKNELVNLKSGNLFLLPTHRESQESTELLESGNLLEVIAEAEQMFDIIIIDTLAINDGMDAFIISKNCDGVLYLTVENKTRKNELQEHKQILDEADVDIIGVILMTI